MSEEKKKEKPRDEYVAPCDYRGKEHSVKKEKPEAPVFSPRQRSILDALVRGLSNDEIASLLNLSRARIKQHLNELYTILGAANRTEAVALALRRQLLAN